MDTTKRIYHITKQLYPTSDKPYFIVAQIFDMANTRTWYSTYLPSYATLEEALSEMTEKQAVTAKANN